jgi:glucose/arabinose dehydrogenase
VLAVAATGCGGGSDRVRTVEVAAGLDRPVYVAAAPGEPGRLYVVGQAGVVTILEDRRERPFLDLSDDVLTSPKGEFASERGMLSIAFAPDFAASGRYWVDYTDRNGAVNVVELSARDPSVVRTILRVPKASERHHGGQLQVGPDGALLVSVGDDFTHPSRAQEPDGPLGTILRRAGDGWEVVAYGLRNPWRFSLDRETGDLWVGDVGETSWEEIDVLRSGDARPANLGWDAYEGRERFSGREPRGPGRLVEPVAVYSHEKGCAVTGGYVYRGEAVPALAGRYVFGDYCTGTVWSLDAAAPGEARVELELGTTLASFGEDESGELYLVSRTGMIFRLASA